MDRRVPWLVYGIVVAVVVLLGCGVLAYMLPQPAGACLAREGITLEPCAWLPSHAAGRQSVLLAPGGLLLIVAAPTVMLTVLVTAVAWFLNTNVQDRGPGRATGQGSKPSLAVADSPGCSACGRRVEPDWIVCPFCATELGRRTG